MCDEVLGVDMRVVRRTLHNSTANKVYHDRQAIIGSCPSWPRDSQVKTILAYVRHLVEERRNSGFKLRTSRPVGSSVDFAAIWRAVRFWGSESSLSGGVMSKLDVVKILHRILSNTSIRDFALLELDNRLRKDRSSQSQA